MLELKPPPQRLSFLGPHNLQSPCVTIPAGGIGMVVHANCIFPFSYGGVDNISSCIRTTDGEQPWCPTRVKH